MEKRKRSFRRQRGYILVMLLGFMTIMGIALTRAMPPVITEVQREQEDELIFRGEAIRDAIRRYKALTGQYPLKLEDLLKVRPRILRQLYSDPMTKEGEWDLVTAVQPGATGDLTGLPIVGVRSRSQKDSFKMYNGKTLYSDWVFSAADNLFGIPGATANPLAPATSDGTRTKGTSTGESDQAKQ
jgi:type II secretory pathway pseudopilin PulG